MENDKGYSVQKHDVTTLSSVGTNIGKLTKTESV